MIDDKPSLHKATAARDGWEVISTEVGVDLHGTEGSVFVNRVENHVEVGSIRPGELFNALCIPKEAFDAMMAALRTHHALDAEPTIEDVCRAWGVRDVCLSVIGPAYAPTAYVVTSRAAAVKRWKVAGEGVLSNADVIGFSRDSRRLALLEAYTRGETFRENHPEHV